MNFKDLKKIILPIFLCLSISYFFTSLISQYTLTTNLQFVFVFIYFLFFCILILFLFNKIVTAVSKKATNILLGISAGIALLLFICIYPMLKTEYHTSSITLKSSENKSESVDIFQESDMIWISHVMVDDIEMSLSEIPLGEGWIYNNEWNDIQSINKSPSDLVLSFPRAHSIKIRFAYYNEFINSTYIVDGQNESLMSTVTLLEDENGYTYTVTSNKRTLSIITLICGYFTFLGITYLLFRICIYKRYYYSVFQLYLLLFIKLSVRNITIANSTYLLILFLIFLSGYLFESVLNDKRMKKYFTIKNTVCIFLLTFYMAFALVAHPLFLFNEFVEIDIIKITVFILFILFIYPYSYISLYFLEFLNMGKKEHLKKSKEDIRKKQWLSFGIIFIISGVLSLGYYPGNMTSDGVDQWSQAIGLSPIRDAHTPIHTIIIRLCSKIVETPFIIVIFHILAFSIIISKILSYFYKRGMHHKILITISVLIAVNPDNILMLTLISKNVIFTLLLLWLLYFIIKLIDNPIYFFKSIRNLIFLSVTLALLNLVRKNAFLAVFTIFFLLVIITLMYIKDLKFKPLIVILLTLGAMQFVEGPLYNYFHVQKNSVSTMSGVTVVPCMSYLGLLKKYNYLIPEDIILKMETVAPLEQWENTYFAYNSDLFSFSQPRIQSNNISVSETIKIWFRMLVMYPDVVVKDRLDRTNLVWNVFSSDKIYNSKYAIGIWPPHNEFFSPTRFPNLLNPEHVQANGSFFNKNILTPIPEFLRKITEKIQILDTLIWRNGIHVIFSLIIIIFVINNKRKKVLWVLSPIYATLLTFILVMGWQIHQYLWFFPISIFVVACYSILPHQDK